MACETEGLTQASSKGLTYHGKALGLTQHLKTITTKLGWGCRSAVKCLPSMPKALPGSDNQPSLWGRKDPREEKAVEGEGDLKPQLGTMGAYL